jgi:hypothetical protein
MISSFFWFNGFGTGLIVFSTVEFAFFKKSGGGSLPGTFFSSYFTSCLMSYYYY